MRPHSPGRRGLRPAAPGSRPYSLTASPLPASAPSDVACHLHPPTIVVLTTTRNRCRAWGTGAGGFAGAARGRYAEVRPARVNHIRRMDGPEQPAQAGTIREVSLVHVPLGRNSERKARCAVALPRSLRRSLRQRSGLGRAPPAGWETNTSWIGPAFWAARLPQLERESPMACSRAGHEDFGSRSPMYTVLRGRRTASRRVWFSAAISCSRERPTGLPGWAPRSTGCYLATVPSRRVASRRTVSAKPSANRSWSRNRSQRSSAAAANMAKRSKSSRRLVSSSTP